MFRPEALRPDPWASQFPAQRWLLGFGALLAWMLLFHLLVNVWLLCVFTSMLLVLGGWLGSQAALDSGSFIHLERFMALERLQSSPEGEQQLEGEIRSMVHKIVRDFVSSWYRTVSSEPLFEEEVERAMLAIATELKQRARMVDRRALTVRVLQLCGVHLRSYLAAREMAAKEEGPSGLWELYCRSCTAHPALRSDAEQVNYSRAVVDLLLHVLVPAPHLDTQTGRFVVGELVACNVILPLLAKLSDPDWLNQLVVSVFAEAGQWASKGAAPVTDPPDAGPTAPQTELWKLQDVEVPSSLTLRVPPEPPIVTEPPTPEMLAYDVIDATELFSQNPEEEESGPEVGTRLFGVGRAEVSPMDYLRPGKFNPFYREPDSDLDSPLSDFRQNSVESLVLIGEDTPSDRFAEYSSPLDGCGAVDPLDELQSSVSLGESSCPRVLVSEGSDRPATPAGMADVRPVPETEQASEGDAIPPGGVQASRCNPNELSVALPPPQACSPLSPFSFEPPSSPEGPIIIQNLRISGTITAKEHRGTGSHPYTLYTIKYETAVDAENADPAPPVAYHTVNRRYSEFLNLQSRLEEKPELRKILKNVKGPKKIFPDLPFGNMDTDRVEARKGLLETFLKQLCIIPETANSEEMQEFLALNTDARIAFVKKSFIVSRIDKIVVNAIVDTLKTAFPRSEPQSPTEDGEADPDGKTQLDNKKNKSRLKFSSKATPVLSVASVQPRVLYCFEEGGTVFGGLSLDSLEVFVAEQERMVGRAPVPEVMGERALRLGGLMGQLQVSASKTTAETGLADVAQDVLGLLMKDQWGWLCTENIQKTIRLLFGTLIDRSDLQLSGTREIQAELAGGSGFPAGSPDQQAPCLFHVGPAAGVSHSGIFQRRLSEDSAGKPIWVASVVRVTGKRSALPMQIPAQTSSHCTTDSLGQCPSHQPWLLEPFHEDPCQILACVFIDLKHYGHTSLQRI
ncbi:sorting nexin-19 isoform X2 [Brienomyrus brachyistius]|uniref:sorting nexin-19 isoform X2 n=1 Tax=Brienomyrus brachyistius TaxID=42636 RepID=UPI0020B38D01|nr:sorting nexin-19 isoform X2 [Brienomyrus brachyistius]